MSGGAPARVKEARRRSGGAPARVKEACRMSGSAPGRVKEACRRSGGAPARVRERRRMRSRDYLRMILRIFFTLTFPALSVAMMVMVFLPIFSLARKLHEVLPVARVKGLWLTR